MKKSIILSLIICSSILSYGQLSIGLSAGFNQHTKYSYIPWIDTSADITSKLNYLELPIFLKFNTKLNQVNLFYGFGPYFSYGIQGKITTEIKGTNDLTISERMEWDKVYDYSDLVNYYGYANIKRFDYGIGTMFGLEYKKFMLIASYRYGLRNVMWEYYQDEKMSNSSLSLSIGYNFSGLFLPKEKDIK